MNFSPNAYSKTGFLPSKDQTPIFYRHYQIDNKKASIVLVHGFGEHSGRYFHVIDVFRKEGFEVLCIDFRGHGHSKGKRGDIEDFSLYEDDVMVGIKHIRSQQDQKKVFLLAHSMGALVALRLIARHNPAIDGMVLSCPLFGLKLHLPPWKKWVSLALARVVPQLRIATGITGKHLSSDQEFANAYDKDPLILKNLSLRAFREMFNGYQESQALAFRISSAFFLQIAGSDPVVDSDAAKQWFDCVDRARTDGSIKIYPGFLHEIYNESRRQDAINDALFWFNSRV